MPHVVTTGIAGQVVIRGNGLSGVSAVSFGSTPATAVNVVSDTEVHASYPATLTAQTIPVTLNGGSVAFSGSIVALDPQHYTAQTLALPEAPQRILGTLYDAQRRALFVAAGFTQTSNNKLWQYTYSGSAWSATPAIVPIADLRSITFSNDGALLLVLTRNSILEFDPANLAAGATRTVAAPFPQPYLSAPQYLADWALANDGYAFIPTGAVGASGGIGSYLYASTAHTFTFMPLTMEQFSLYVYDFVGSPTLAASADGSLILAAQSGLSPPSLVIQYSPDTTLVTLTKISVNGLNNQPPVMDSSAAKRVVYDGTTNSVYDSKYALLGNIPGTVRTLVINRQGTRVYALNQDNTLHSYDLTATPVSGNYPEIGTGNVQTVPASSALIAVHLEISPDGSTLFLTGDTGVAVIPAP